MADEGTGGDATEQGSDKQVVTGAAAIEDAYSKAFPEDAGSFDDILATPASEKTTDGEKTAEGATAPAAEAAGDADPADSKTAEADNATGEASVEVDPSLVSLAVELGADQASMDELVKSDPEGANKLLSELANEYNAKTSRLLFGTDATPTGADTKFLDATDTSGEPEKVEPSKLEAFFADEAKVAAFKEENGELMLSFLQEQLADQKVLREERQYLGTMRDQLAAQQQQSLIAELDQTFTSFGKPYADFYGEGTIDKLSDEQVDNRGKVGDLADMIKASDLRLGNPAKANSKYLVMAHHHVAAELRDKAARQSIIEQIHTRAKSITHKPSAQRVTNIAAKKSDEAAAQALDSSIARLGLESLFPDD